MDALETLSAAPPALDPAAALAMAERLFAITGTIAPLTSERDQNFRIATSQGSFVLKIANPSEDPATTDFQSQALLHVAGRDPALPVPKVLGRRDGAIAAREILPDGRTATVRMITYLEGEPQWKFAATAARRRNLGTLLARLTLALADFSHPAADHALQWDLKRAAGLRDLLDLIEDGSLRTLARRYLDRFEDQVLGDLSALRAQVVHNDLNPHNVIVVPGEPDRIAGILDFGDMVRTPLVFDLAIAASYQLDGSGDGISQAVDFVRAYEGVLPLTLAERAALLPAIAARLVTTIAITSWRARRYPENRDYILRNVPRARAALEALDRLTPAAAVARLWQAD